MPDLNKIIEDLSKLTVVEAAELSKQLEEKWGVTAAAPIAAAAPGAAAGGEEKSEFTIFLAAAGDKKIGKSIFLPNKVVDKSGLPTLAKTFGTKSQSSKEDVFLLKVTSSSAPPSM